MVLVFKNILAGLNVALANDFECEVPDISIKPSTQETFWADFMKNKNTIKERLKNGLENAISAYGEYSTEANEARLKLINFYQKNIEARENGYGQYNYKTIHGILKAIERELNNLTYDNNFSSDVDEIKKYIAIKMQKIEGLD